MTKSMMNYHNDNDDHESKAGMKPDHVDWEKILGQYNDHHVAHKEASFAAKELEPIVWTWSEAKHIPMVSDKAMPEEIAVWKKAQTAVIHEENALKSIENNIQKLYRSSPGNMVTGETLMKFVPDKTARESLEHAFGISKSEDRLYGEETFSIAIAKRLLSINKGIAKSNGQAWIVPDVANSVLKKNLPFIAHNIGSDGDPETGKGKGFPLRWDAVGDYLLPVWKHEDEMMPEDWDARDYAERISGKKQTEHVDENGDTYYKIHLGFRPRAVEFFETEAAKHVATREAAARKKGATPYRQHLADMAKELVEKVVARRKEIAGLPGNKGDMEKLSSAEKKSGAFHLVHRYSKEKVQPGTKAAHSLNSGAKMVEGVEEVANTKQLIPEEGQKGTVAYHKMNEGEGKQNRRVKIDYTTGGPKNLRSNTQFDDEAPVRLSSNHGTFLAFGEDTRTGIQMNDEQAVRDRNAGRQYTNNNLVEGVGGADYEGRGTKSRIIKIYTSISGREDELTPEQITQRLLNPEVKIPIKVKQVFEGARKQLFVDVVKNGQIRVNGQLRNLSDTEVSKIDEAARALCDHAGIGDDYDSVPKLQRLAKEFVVEQLWFSMRWEKYGTATQRLARFDPKRGNQSRPKASRIRSFQEFADHRRRRG